MSSNASTGHMIRIATLLLLMVFLTAGPALAQEDQVQEQTAVETPAIGTPSDVAFQGKLYCSLKRVVPIVFKGIITELRVQDGQYVEEGEELAQMQIAPEVIPELRERLAHPGLYGLEAQIAQVQGELAKIRTKYKELKQLVEQNLATEQSMNVLTQQIGALEKQYKALKLQFESKSLSADDEVNILKSILGEDASYSNIPDVVSLRAPIAGYVVWIDPMVRVGAEVDKSAAFAIGIMDPMIIRANLYESEASQLQPGDVAKVTVSSIPGMTFEAEVSRLSWTTISPGLDKPSHYEVELTVDNPDLILKDGYKAEVTF